MASIDVHAVFIDVMGFANAVQQLDARESSQLEKNLRYSIGDPTFSPAVTNLTNRYRRFHDLIMSEVDFNESTIEFVVTFSDSAYIVTEHLETAARIAFNILRGCLFADIPARAGIGRGTFARLAFSTLSHPAGLLIADAPFLGTSIINAYRAEETQTAPGFRVFVHPSAVWSERPFWVADLLDDESSEDASHEVDFVTLWPAYIPQDQYPALVEHVNAMRAGVTSSRVLRHYDATLAAMARLHERGMTYPRRVLRE